MPLSRRPHALRVSDSRRRASRTEAGTPSCKSATTTAKPSTTSIQRKSRAMTGANSKLLMKDPGIVRNRLKIASAVGNAKAFLQVQKEFGSFDNTSGNS